MGVIYFVRLDVAQLRIKSVPKTVKRCFELKVFLDKIGEQDLFWAELVAKK